MAEGQSVGQGGDPLLEALEEILNATRGAQRALRESEARIERNISRLRGGEPAVRVVQDVPSSNARTEINDALDRLIATRQRARAATFRRLIEEGMTRKEIAANWGFSQQVVSRIVNYELPSEQVECPERRRPMPAPRSRRGRGSR
ncbi:MAG: hypothetical protein ACLQPH_19480 [Acidimicrobiales bacterium]